MSREAHFSMIRSFQLADLFTIANAVCGVGAIFQAMRALVAAEARLLYLAGALVPLALLFDVLDGRVARWRRSSSPLGRELDSLADVISFGVAPAAIAFAAGCRTPLDVVLLLYFVACGVSRLARYNVTAASTLAKVEFFEGTPIPTSVIPLGALLLAHAAGNLLPVRVLGMELHLVTLLFAMSGTLMISKSLRLPKL